MKDYELTDEERDLLSEGDKIKYDTAILYCNDSWACGPFGGWVRGHKLLKELGWKEQSRSEGQRTFVSLIKPKIYDMKPIVKTMDNAIKRLNQISNNQA